MDRKIKNDKFISLSSDTRGNVSKISVNLTCYRHVGQPRSQGLSSLPPLVVERKTLVAAGHVTTQNLGGKKICWLGGVAECFVRLM